MNNVHEWSSAPFHCYSAQFCATQQSTSVRDDQVFETTYRTSKHPHSFFQNAFTSWVHHASFLKLCFWSTAIADHVSSPAQGAALSSKCLFSVFQFMKCSWLDSPVEGPTRRRGPEEQEPCFKACHGRLVIRISWRIRLVWANNASPMILNVLCRISLCGVLKIFHPCLCAISKSPRLNGSAMLALLGTLSSIWWSWYLLCHVQWAPMMLLSGWCLPVPLRMACFDASLSHSWI